MTVFEGEAEHMHEPIDMKIFRCCPSCQSKGISFDGIKKFHCRACSFTFFHNVAAAVAAVLEYDDQIVLIERNKEPGKGKLDLPGGFADPDESAEDAVRREVKEELGLDLGELKYLGSYPNTYDYKGVTYKTCDLFFSSKINTLPTVFDTREIKELVLMHPSEMVDEQIAFESTKMCLHHFLHGRQ
jgi:ADP-ribose pyrophosphatase YjhB (NUDIX family)